jgi:UDP-N-acetylmuramate: L-alanyl-gamma-D-glutamyl-meso-diaminopimelate ligase
MNYHFIAIGGSAMHNLALALHDSGHQITGSDDALYDPAKIRLEQAGIAPKVLGYRAENIHQGLDAVVLGMHAKADNVELIKAQELGVTIYSYPEFVYEQSKHKTRVVIAGSHGKTTITSMILHAMHYHGKEIDYLVGAQLEGFDRMVRLSDSSDFIIIEGDEYLSSAIDRRSKFLWYQPNIALVSGIAWDHINVFTTEDIYIDQFRKFMNTIVPGGSLTYFENDPKVKALVDELQVPIRKFPYVAAAHEVAADQTMVHTEEGELPLKVFGEHNMANLEGARWICQQLGIEPLDFYETMMSFKGAAKRLERMPSSRGTVFKDFAHAPSKVRATCSAVRKQFPDKKLHAVLELHTFSSLTPVFIEQYNGALSSADTAVVMYDPESLVKKGMAPLDTSFIQRAFDREDLTVINSVDVLRAHLEPCREENAIVLMMSSGTFAGFDFGYFQNE